MQTALNFMALFTGCVFFLVIVDLALKSKRDRVFNVCGAAFFLAMAVLAVACLFSR